MPIYRPMRYKYRQSCIINVAIVDYGSIHKVPRVIVKLFADHPAAFKKSGKY